MSINCPACNRAVRSHTEKRYLPGDLIKDRYQTAHSVLKKYICPSSICKKVFISRKDIPAETNLAVMESLLDDLAIWNTALTVKPGIHRMGTTAGDFTKLIHRDPAVVYKQVLARCPLAKEN